MALKVTPEDFEILKTIGVGSLSRVNLAVLKTTGECFALKMVDKSQALKLKQVDHLISEFNVLKTINHPWVVNLVHYFQDERYVYFALEFVSGGDLFRHIRFSAKLESYSAMLYTAQVVTVLEYLHSLNIVYRDLKPENLLIQKDGYLKLTDFGISKIVEDRTYTLCGTPEYLAPEVILSKGHGKAADFWSLGVLVYEMITGIDPFCDDFPMVTYRRIVKGEVRFPRRFDPAAKSLVKKLLQVDLSKRLGNLKNGVNDIKAHKWFRGLNWEKLANSELDMPYLPKVTDDCDTSNFSEFFEPPQEVAPLEPSKDPFLIINEIPSLY